jgi:response regulator RpfG family c-di-GMP phosphodiesterase
VAEKPDLIILDLGLPDIRGLELLRMIRARTENVPIVVLSSRGDEVGKVQALDLGADDYITKPFGTEELLARMRAALRHQLQVHGERPIFHAGDLSVDLVRRIVKVAGARNDTSMAQFRTRRPSHISEMPLERPSYVTRWRRTGWLGRPDSNLRISESEFVKSFEMAARLHTRLEGSYQARRWRRFVSASLARFACDDLYGAGGRGPAVVCEGSHGVTGSDSSYKE